MKKIILLFVIFVSIAGSAQELYVKTFGNAAAKPVIFLHGGPGYNAVGFEVTTAQQLADEGFFVIVYDRRGEGRSVDANAKYDFGQTFADINDIFKKYNLKKVALLGHSFGGIVAVLYAQKFQQHVSSIILISAPVALQESFRTILSSSRKLYEEKDDKTNLNYLDMIDDMDPKSMEYASYTFMHAMQNGFYSPKKRMPEAAEIYEKLKKSPDFKYATQMTREAPMGFWENESYTTIDLTRNIESLISAKVPISGLYGKDDGLYSEAQVMQLQEMLGKGNVQYFDDCSHNVFIDQQNLFLKWTKNYLN